MRSFRIELTVAAMTLLLAVLAGGTGCSDSGEAPAATLAPTSTPVATLPPAPLPTPTVLTESEAWNIIRTLPGLEITLTVVHWTGNDLNVEWIVENRSGQYFKKDILNDIFSFGALAVDQDGIEGEYFIPKRFTRDLKHGERVPYETRWILYPESREITVHLWDIREPVVGSHVDASAEFLFSR